VPWQSGAQLEAKLPTDAKLSTAAVEWMQSPEVGMSLDVFGWEDG